MHTLLRSLRALATGALLVLAAHAAEPAKKNYDLTAGEAAVRLKQFSETSGRETLFAAEAVRGVRTTAIKGEFTPKEALDHMLDGTGLVAVQDEKTGALAVRRDASPNALRAAQNSDRPANQKGEVKDGTLVLEKIEVTGSRIRGLVGEADFSPVLSYSRQDIERAGVTSIGELSRLIPQAYSSGSYDGIGFGGQGQGTEVVADGSRGSSLSVRTTFNLRGLGTQNTLVLIDGRRVAKTGVIRGNDGVDLSGIPVSSIERVEVLTDGASAVYGSDAVGGVINIILRKQYAGTELNLTYENTFDSDTAVRTATLTHTLNRNKLFLSLSATYQDRAAFAARDRYFSATNDWSTLGGTQTLLTGANSFSSGNFSLGAGLVRAVSGNLPGRTQIWAVIPDNATGALQPAANFGSAAGAAANAPGYMGDRAVYANLISPQTSKSAGFRLSYQFTPNLEVFADGRYSHTLTEIEGLPINWGSANPVTVPANYPGNPFGVPVRINKTFWELGNIGGEKDAVSANTNFVVGARGSLPHDWRYETSVNWNRGLLQDKNGYEIRIPTTTLRAEVDAQRIAIFYDSRTQQPNDLAYLRSLLNPANSYDRAEDTTWSISADGPVWNLPAGSVRIAAGAEYRDESAETKRTFADDASINLSLLGNFDRNIQSAFTEVRVPVIGPKQQVPLVHRFDLKGAVRYDRYSDFGGRPSPGYGAQWRPVSWVLIRGSINEAFRAPNLQSVYRPVATLPGDFSFQNPLLIDRARNNEVILAADVVNGGNPALKAEKSKSYNYGILIEPPVKALKGFSFGVDFVRFDYEDRLGDIGSFQNLIDLFPDRLTRGAKLPGDPASFLGPITKIDTRSFNIAAVQIESIDYQLAYSRQTGWGSFDVRAAATDYRRYDSKAQLDSATISTLYDFPSRYSWQTYWTKGRYGAGISGFYQEKRWLNATQTTVRFRSAVEWNLQLAYDFSAQPRSGGEPARGQRLLQGTKISLTVFNVFDREPPHVQGNAGFAVTDPRMARYALTLKKIF